MFSFSNFSNFLHEAMKIDSVPKTYKTLEAKVFFLTEQLNHPDNLYHAELPTFDNFFRTFTKL